MKKIISSFLVLLFVFSLSASAYAIEATMDGESITYTLYDPATGIYTPIKPEDYTTGDPEYFEHLDVNYEATARESFGSDSSISPMALIWTFSHYSPYSSVHNYEFLKIGAGRSDNRGGVTPLGLIATVSSTASTSATITSGATIGGEVDGVVAKIKADYTATAAFTVSWTLGTTYTAKSETPPGMVGYMEVYVPGINTNGVAVYKILDTATEKITYEQKALGARVPDNMLNFKVVHKYS